MSVTEEVDVPDETEDLNGVASVKRAIRKWTADEVIFGSNHSNSKYFKFLYCF